MGEPLTDETTTRGGGAGSRRVPVRLGERSYEILIGRGLLDAAGEVIESWLNARPYWRGGPRRALIVTDENVAQHAGRLNEVLGRAGWEIRTHVLPSGERTKALEYVEQMYGALAAMKADRRTVVLAVGGGVVGDTAGFAAATYARGLGFVQVPTTLLAQVDSSVGGKVGINLPSGKNLVGAFHQPIGVLIDTETLGTLPEREYRSGLAEVVKYGVILDAAFFEALESSAESLVQRVPAAVVSAIARSCELKAQVVVADEFERTGLRAVLNYGHTFAHAFEALSGYGLLLHGEAVSIGMVYASRLAERLGRIGPDVSERQLVLLRTLGLPTALPPEFPASPEQILEAMRLDKKAVAGRLRFVLPSRLGHVETVSDVPEDLVLGLLRDLHGAR
ncbi:MAG: 3-dehydroquinate synthase [Planctomycetota bacterium]|nr:MAG: 3-dehydroquinate synthase [Planctomycetota bacterium]